MKKTTTKTKKTKKTLSPKVSSKSSAKASPKKSPKKSPSKQSKKITALEAEILALRAALAKSESGRASKVSKSTRKKATKKKIKKATKKPTEKKSVKKLAKKKATKKRAKKIISATTKESRTKKPTLYPYETTPSRFRRRKQQPPQQPQPKQKTKRQQRLQTYITQKAKLKGIHKFNFRNTKNFTPAQKAAITRAMNNKQNQRVLKFNFTVAPATPATRKALSARYESTNIGIIIERPIETIESVEKKDTDKFIKKLNRKNKRRIKSQTITDKKLTPEKMEGIITTVIQKHRQKRAPKQRKLTPKQYAKLSTKEKAHYKASQKKPTKIQQEKNKIENSLYRLIQKRVKEWAKGDDRRKPKDFRLTELSLSDYREIIEKEKQVQLLNAQHFANFSDRALISETNKHIEQVFIPIKPGEEITDLVSRVMDVFNPSKIMLAMGKGGNTQSYDAVKWYTYQQEVFNIENRVTTHQRKHGLEEQSRFTGVYALWFRR